MDYLLNYEITLQLITKIHVSWWIFFYNASKYNNFNERNLLWFYRL